MSQTTLIRGWDGRKAWSEIETRGGKRNHQRNFELADMDQGSEKCLIYFLGMLQRLSIFFFFMNDADGGVSGKLLIVANYAEEADDTDDPKTTDIHDN